MSASSARAFGLMLGIILFGMPAAIRAEERPGSGQFLKGLTVSSIHCKPQAFLSCEAALKLLQAGDYEVVQPTKIIPSRNDPEFASLFSSCKLAPESYSEDLDWGAAQTDPFYESITAGQRTEGEYLAYGPFSIYSIKLADGQTRRIIEATGYKGLGNELSDLHTFSSLPSKNLCSPHFFGSRGYYSSKYSLRLTGRSLRSWGRLIVARGKPYVATFQANGGGTSGLVKLAPADIAVTNRYSVPRASVSFSAVDPADK